MPTPSLHISSLCRLAATVLVAAALTSCWEREPTPKPAPAPQPAAKAEPPSPIAAAPEPKAPETLQILRLMPDTVTGIAAFPSLGRFYHDWLELVRRFAPDPAGIDRWVSAALSRSAQELNAPGAASLEDLLRAKGLDPDAPVGLVVDAGPLAQAYGDALAAERAQDGPDSEGSTKPRHVEINATPRIAMIVHSTDPGLAEQTAKAAVTANAQTVASARERDVAGVTVHVFTNEGMAYFLRDGWVVIGNSEELLRQIADRFDRPARIRYGTKEVPSFTDGEAVALVRADRLVALMRGLLPLAAVARPGLSPWLDLPSPLLERAAEAYTDDPLMVTLRHDREQVELVARLDYSRHPKVEKIFGEPGPLRLATVLPADTVGFLSMRITDENKATLEEAWFEAPRRFKDPQVRRSMEILHLLLQITGNHLSIGVAGLREGWPRGIVIIELGDTDTTRALLSTLGGSYEPVETHAGTEIFEVPLPLPARLYYAFAGNLLLLADDVAQMRSSLGLVSARQVSPMFERFAPPYDPAQPRYNALLLTNEFFTGILAPLMTAQTAMETDLASAILRRIGENVQQVRASRTVQNGWREGRLTIHLKPVASTGQTER